MATNVQELVEELRTARGDSMRVEVKSATGGLPESLNSTLSALSNLPGGGVIILGLDERTGFRPVVLKDPQTLKQGLALKARSLTPPVSLVIEDARVDGQQIIIARVQECDSSMKPCRITATGAAYLRGYDGDFRLSDVEEQAFLLSRRSPMVDRQPCAGAVFGDLDHELVEDFISTVRDRDPQGLGRFSDEKELLRRACVIDSDEVPTVAGILALGLHPQEWYPRYVIQMAAEPRIEDPGSIRARNQITLTGPIPRMIDGAMAWARRTFDTAIVSDVDGTVRDQPAYPLVAFRELVANALIHRDLDQWSMGLAVEVRLRADRLVVSNPGGLYGITVDRLGQDVVTSARNPRLVDVCQNVRSPESGRVIEALATGIPTIALALEDYHLPSAQYVDSGIRFTAILRQPVSSHSKRLSKQDVQIYDYLLTHGQKTVGELRESLSVEAPTVRASLRRLRAQGLTVQHGGKGKYTTYEAALRQQ